MSNSRLTRLQFLTGSLAAPAALGLLASQPAEAQAAKPTAQPPNPADIAEFSYFWTGVERVKLARGTVCNGGQMYVEYQIPAKVTQPWPIVLIHGGAGQGTDWMTTPDGRPGWFHYLLAEGFKVYVVDRPGQGRPPFHPNLNGNFENEAWTFERAAKEYGSQFSDPAVLDQLIAPLGPAMPNNQVTWDLWRTRGAMLLDEIGPAILLTHGTSSTFAFVTADERPNLVKGIVAIEPFAPPAASLKNLGAIPIAAFVSETSTTKQPAQRIPGAGVYLMMEKNNRTSLQPVLDWIRKSVPGPATEVRETSKGPDSTAMKMADQGIFWVGVQRKKMPYGTIATGQSFVQYYIPSERKYPYPVVLVHGGGGQGTHMMGIGRRPGWVHYFLQEGYAVYCIDRTGFGRPPYHPDTLGPAYLRNFPIYEGLTESKGVFNNERWPGRGGMGDPLIDQFMANETSRVGDEVAHSEMVAAGGAELLDRIGPAVLCTTAFGGFYGWTVADRRPGLVKGIVCMEGNGIPFADAFRWGLTAIPITYDPPARDASELKLVDTTLPADSPLPLVATYKIQAEPARKLKNLQGIPIGWVTGEFGAGGNGIAQVNFLKQAGCAAELLRLRDLGSPGSGNLMQMEKNNRQVFDIIRDWLDRKVARPV